MNSESGSVVEQQTPSVEELSANVHDKLTAVAADVDALVAASKIVVEKPAPIPVETTQQMLDNEAQRAANSALAGAAAESIAATSVARAEQPLPPLAPDAITEVPAGLASTPVEAPAPVAAAPIISEVPGVTPPTTS